MVDTGSTDGTVQFLEKINEHIEEKNPLWEGLPKIQIEHFEWVDDFSKAREYSFSFLKTDYGFWLDGDDELSSADEFIKWRDNLMHAAHYWIATYNYAFNDAGQPVCQFIRERVVKLNYGFGWRYFVHEGLVKIDGGKFWAQKVSSWWVNHRRTEEDKKQDHLRNINILKKYEGQGDLPSRMLFYQGKELVENGFEKEGCEPLLKALRATDLDLHDRIMAIQYAAHSAVKCQAFDQAIDLLMNGIKLMFSRAEYWCLLGDVYCLTNNLGNAILAYETALNCRANDLNGHVVVHGYAYNEYPKMKLCDISMMVGDFDGAKRYLQLLKDMGHESVKDLEPKLMNMLDLSIIRQGLPKVPDVVISCPPQSLVSDWDENTLKEKGHGGSETAAIEVARWIKKKTGRPVKIFHPRMARQTMESGVEYIPSSEASGYFRNVEPHVCISWRNAFKLTAAKNYVWCHDLQLPFGHLVQNYDKVIALSEFHKNYLKEVSGVPFEKCIIGFNGINPDDFPKEPVEKDPLKVVFSSSPDRGIEQAIDVVKLARDKSGLDIKLHCFYGTENMRKSGQVEWADAIEKKIKENSDFVISHGMVPKKELMMHFAEAGTWLYINNFLETFCITALEAICSKTWPIFRKIAALPYTLKDAIDRGHCDMILSEAKEDTYDEWADKLISAIQEKKWEKMDFKAEDYSWEKVADFFIKEMEL